MRQSCVVKSQSPPHMNTIKRLKNRQTNVLKQLTLNRESLSQVFQLELTTAPVRFSRNKNGQLMLAVANTMD